MSDTTIFDERQENMYQISDIEEVRKRLLKISQQPPTNQINLYETIEKLYDVLIIIRGSGYSLTQICKILNDNNIKIKMSTLTNYLYRIKNESFKSSIETKQNKKHVNNTLAKQKEIKRRNATIQHNKKITDDRSSFDIQSDSTDL